VALDGSVLSALAEKKFGGPTRLIFDSVSVGTTVTRVLDNNPNRVFWALVNLSANRGFIWWSEEVSTSLGIPLEAGIGFVSMSADEDGETTGYAVYAVNQNAAGTWARIQVVRI